MGTTSTDNDVSVVDPQLFTAVIVISYVPIFGYICVTFGQYGCEPFGVIVSIFGGFNGSPQSIII